MNAPKIAFHQRSVAVLLAASLLVLAPVAYVIVRDALWPAEAAQRSPDTSSTSALATWPAATSGSGNANDPNGVDFATVVSVLEASLFHERLLDACDSLKLDVSYQGELGRTSHAGQRLHGDTRGLLKWTVLDADGDVFYLRLSLVDAKDAIASFNLLHRPLYAIVETESRSPSGSVTNDNVRKLAEALDAAFEQRSVLLGK